VCHHRKVQSIISHKSDGPFYINLSLELVDPLELNNVQDIVFPVTFLKGQLNYSNPNVTSGFIQVRPFDKRGAAYAMCPGVRY